MVSSTITLAAIILIPIIVIMALKINAALVFLSLCLGDVLVQFVSPDANQFLTLFSAHVARGIDAGSPWIKVALLLLPLVLTAIFMVGTVKGYAKRALNLLPAIGVGLVGSLLVTPLLPSSVSQNIIDSSLWVQIQKSQNIIVSLSAIVCLVVLWVQRPKTGSKKEKYHKSKA